MKPKPLPSLNHFTVPVSIVMSFFLDGVGGELAPGELAPGEQHLDCDAGE
jgi:hypothetical protein